MHLHVLFSELDLAFVCVAYVQEQDKITNAVDAVSVEGCSDQEKWSGVQMDSKRWLLQGQAIHVSV